MESSLQHFYDKLLLLKDEMNTEEGRRIAEIRDTYIRDFLKEIHKELDS